MSKANEPAFPLSQFQVGVVHNDGRVEGYPTAPTGLTKRELFAAMAMQGLLSNPNICRLNEYGTIECGVYRIQAEARAYADALLVELEKGGGE